MSATEVIIVAVFGFAILLGVAVWMFLLFEDRAERRRKDEALQRAQDEQRRVTDIEARVRASNERVDALTRRRL